MVIGAGPSGLFSAMTAASLGKKVTVLEEHEQVGVPDHCAGHISMRGLTRLGMTPPASVIQNVISRARLYSPSGTSLMIECDEPKVYVVDRSAFDQHLAQLASAEGATLMLGCRADKFHEESNVVRGVETTLGRVESDVVIDAEGVNPRLLRSRGLSTPPHKRVVVGAQVEVPSVDDVERDCVEIYLGSKYAPGFYAWIIPRSDGSAKVGLGASKGNPRQLLERFLQRHPIASRKIKAPRGAYVFHPIPLCGPQTRTYHGGLLIVGDAASQVKPTTGGGVIFGMTCARHAGAIAASAVEAEDNSARFLSAYERCWRAELSREFAVALAARRLFNRMSDRAIDRVFRAAEFFDGGKCLSQINEIDFVTEILSKTLRKPRGLLMLLSTMALSVLP